MFSYHHLFCWATKHQCVTYLSSDIYTPQVTVIKPSPEIHAGLGRLQEPSQNTWNENPSGLTPRLLLVSAKSVVLCFQASTMGREHTKRLSWQEVTGKAGIDHKMCVSQAIEDVFQENTIFQVYYFLLFDSICLPCMLLSDKGCLSLPLLTENPNQDLPSFINFLWNVFRLPNR